MGEVARLRHRVARVALALTLAACGLAQDGAPWRGFATFAWCPAGFEADAAALRVLRDLGVTGVALAVDQDSTAARQLGFRIWVDQLVGKGTLELRAEQFEPLRTAYERDRGLAALVRPSCLSEPAVQGQLVARAVAALGLLEAWRGSVAAISLGDEISTTRHVNPLDFSFSEAALGEFRTGLRARFRDVAELNRAWGSEFASFAEVLPYTADRIRAREFALLPELPRNLRPWAEHRSFMDDALARTTRSLAGLVRGRFPAPCGFTGLQPPAAYGGTDYAKLVPDLDLYEVYDIGGARALAMSLVRGNAKQIATIFPPDQNRSLATVAVQLAECFAQGMSGAVLWHAGLMVERGASPRPTPYGQAVAQALRDLQPCAVLAGARRALSPLWVVESHPAVQLHWMLDSLDDGPTWVRRLSSYEETHSSSLAARVGAVRICEDLGLQPRLVPAEQIEERLAKETPRAILLPLQVALSDAAVAALTSYVERGGHLIADGMVAYYDAHLQRRERPALDAVFGLEARQVPRRDALLVRQGVPLPDARLASGAAAVERGLRAGLAESVADGLLVQVEHRFGRGTAHYLNIALCEYGAVRLDPKRVLAARDLRRRVAAAFEVAGLRAPVEVRGAGLPTCIARTLLSAATGRRYLFVRLQANDNPAVLEELIKRGPVQVQLDFVEPVRIAHRGKWQGPAQSFEFELDPRLGLCLEVAR